MHTRRKLTFLASKTLILLGCAFSSLVFGIGGEVIDINHSPEQFIPSFCKVIQRFQNRPDCTGSLIAPGIVATAAHCVENQDDRKNLVVKCGFTKKKILGFRPSFRSGVKEIKTDPRYYSDLSQAISSDTFVSEASLDFALLFLRRESKKIEPLSTPKSIKDVSERFFNPPDADGNLLLKDQVECRYAGFGEDTYFKAGNPLVANLYSGKNENYDLALRFGVPQDSFNSFAVGLPFLQNIPKPDTTTGPKNQMLQGDSGGPLVCRENSTSPWVLIGINSRTLQPRDYFEVVTENGVSRSRLDLKSGVFQMGFAPTFSDDFQRLR